MEKDPSAPVDVPVVLPLTVTDTPLRPAFWLAEATLPVMVRSWANRAVPHNNEKLTSNVLGFSISSIFFDQRNWDKQRNSFTEAWKLCKRSGQFTRFKCSASVFPPKYDIIFPISLQISFEKLHVLVCNRLHDLIKWEPLFLTEVLQRLY
jgi:hypothetical protein